MPKSSKEIRDDQIEAGEQIVKGTLRDLAIQLGRPEIAELSFTKRTFDEPEQVSLIDSAKRVVTRIEGDHLADAPATPSRRQQLKDQVRVDVIAFLGKK